MQYQKNRFVFFIVVSFLSLVFIGCHDSNTDVNIITQYIDVVEDEKYILHALGGMEGQYTYINSIDCLEENYASGYRLFEVDVSFTSDGKLVLAHSTDHNVWSKADWASPLMNHIHWLVTMSL